MPFQTAEAWKLNLWPSRSLSDETIHLHSEAKGLDVSTCSSWTRCIKRNRTAKKNGILMPFQTAEARKLNLWPSRSLSDETIHLHSEAKGPDLSTFSSWTRCIKRNRTSKKNGILMPCQNDLQLLNANNFRWIGQVWFFPLVRSTDRWFDDYKTLKATHKTATVNNNNDHPFLTKWDASKIRSWQWQHSAPHSHALFSGFSDADSTKWCISRWSSTPIHLNVNHWKVNLEKHPCHGQKEYSDATFNSTTTLREIRASCFFMKTTAYYKNIVFD